MPLRGPIFSMSNLEVCGRRNGGRDAIGTPFEVQAKVKGFMPTAFTENITSSTCGTAWLMGCSMIVGALKHFPAPSALTTDCSSSVERALLYRETSSSKPAQNHNPFVLVLPPVATLPMPTWAKPAWIPCE